jgi:UDP-N-acetylmuramyl pentapeptide phosphotransferase/UDP-N-acetylglucosamine-1-phosphate transferase
MMLLSIFFAGVLAAFLTYWFSRRTSAFYIPDLPNPRSLHERAVARSGGLAIVLAMIAAVSVSGLPHTLLVAAPGLVPGFLLVAAVSYVDDRWATPAALRLLVHLGSALLLVKGGLSLATLHVPGLAIAWPGWIATGATLLFVAWMVNLYNFMDGIDGLAGGMAVVGFGAYAVLGYLAGDPAFAGASLIVAAAAAGFLLFNFPPARCFMGDTGSSALGFLAAAFALWSSYQWIIPLWISLLVFSPFVVDATVTLLRRIGAGERFWEAHDTHYYQRLVRVGWTHRRTVTAAYALMVFCAGIAAVALRAPVPGRWAVLGTVACVYVLLIRAVRGVEARARRAHLPSGAPSPRGVADCSSATAGRGESAALRRAR